MAEKGKKPKNLTCPRKFTDEMIEDALYKAMGVQSKAARMLGCSFQIIHKRIKESEHLQDVLKKAPKRALDLAKDLIFTNVEIAKEQQVQYKKDEEGNLVLDNDGNPIPITKKVVDSSDAKWVAERLGKDEGFSLRQEVTGADGASIEVTMSVVTKEDVNKSNG